MAYKTHELNPLSIEFGQCIYGHYINEWCKDQIENEGSHIKEAKRLRLMQANNQTIRHITKHIGRR